MNKKLSLIVVAIAVILIIVGGYLIFNNQSGEITSESSDIPLKTHNFKLFKIETPQGSNFTIKNEADGMKFYQNNGNFSGNFSGIIINKGLTDSLIGDNDINILNSSNQQIYSSDFKNQTQYKIVSHQDDADLILIGNDLNLLKEVSDTIKIKDVGNL